MRIKHSQSGFTLVELMMVVALIGVLSAIAIPSFLTYQARSRRAESFTNLGGIATAQKSYQATAGDFHDSGNAWPDFDAYGGLGVTKMTWDTDSENAFGELGWQPEGAVFYSYHTNKTNDCSCTLCFTASAYGDVDGDGSPTAVMWVEPQRTTSGIVIGACASGFPAPLNLGTPVGPAGPIYNAAAAHGALDNF
jgi:prepilin-type N-terminal cleavage/methylation domain-containing protein